MAKRNWDSLHLGQHGQNTNITIISSADGFACSNTLPQPISAFFGHSSQLLDEYAAKHDSGECDANHQTNQPPK